MRYKFQEFVKKQEERFTKKEVTNSSLIRISDANHYFEMYVKRVKEKEKEKLSFTDWLKQKGYTQLGEEYFVNAKGLTHIDILHSLYEKKLIEKIESLEDDRELQPPAYYVGYGAAMADVVEVIKKFNFLHIDLNVEASMKTLLEDYKRRLKTIMKDLKNGGNDLTINRLGTKASCYRTFISELEKTLVK